MNRSIWGIPDADGPFMGSGLVEFSFGLPEAPKTNTPPDGRCARTDDDPHDKVRVAADAPYDQTTSSSAPGRQGRSAAGPAIRSERA